jgi:HNH endonuclease
MNLERFWQKVQRCPHGDRCEDCCWIWMASHRGRQGQQYGQFAWREDGRQHNESAHRLSWMITYGEIPHGVLVLHNCPEGDNPSCVNPQHLWLGTSKENTHDAIKKGRFVLATPGRIIKGRWLTQSQVLDIRYLAAHGMPQRLLGSIYGVHHTMIGLIVRGKHWKHLPLIVEER